MPRPAEISDLENTAAGPLRPAGESDETLELERIAALEVEIQRLHGRLAKAAEPAITTSAAEPLPRGLEGVDPVLAAELETAERAYSEAVIARSRENTGETRERCRVALREWDRLRGLTTSRFT
jgi:hypothetical protein